MKRWTAILIILFAGVLISCQEEYEEEMEETVEETPMEGEE